MPVETPFTSQSYTGVVPPLTGVAVKVTEVPVQIGLAEAMMETPAVGVVPTIIVIALEVAGLPVTQVRDEDKVTVTLSPSFKVLLV